MSVSLNAGELFVRAVGHLGALAVGGVEKSEQLRLCKETRGYLLELAAKTEKAVEPVTQRSRKLEQDLVSYHKDQVNLAEKQRKLKEQSRDLEATIASWSSQVADLDREIREHEEKLNSLGARIRSAEQNALGKIVFGFAFRGFEDVAVSHAVVALMNQKNVINCQLETASTKRGRLIREKENAERELERRKEQARGLERELSDLKDRISIRDKEIKLCGANLTKIRNLVIELREMMEKYRFLGHRVEEIRDAVELDILDMNDVIGAKKQLEAIQQSETAQILSERVQASSISFDIVKILPECERLKRPWLDPQHCKGGCLLP